MKKCLIFLVCLSCFGEIHAENSEVSFCIRIDTAFVSNDSNIELEYSVFASFTEIHLSVFTNMDDPAARQNVNAPQLLAGSKGSYKKRIPVNLPLDQIVEIHIFLNGVGLTNVGDAEKYATSIQKTLVVKRQNGQVINYRTTYTPEEMIALEASMKHYRLYNNKGELTDGFGALIDVDSQGREISRDPLPDQMALLSSNPLALNIASAMYGADIKQDEGTSRAAANYSFAISGYVYAYDGSSNIYSFSERLSGCKVYLLFYNSNISNSFYHPVDVNKGLINGTHFNNTDNDGIFNFFFTTYADLANYNKIFICVSRENDYVTLANIPSAVSISCSTGSGNNIFSVLGLPLFDGYNTINFNPSNTTQTHSNKAIMAAFIQKMPVCLKWFGLAGGLASQHGFYPPKINIYEASLQTGDESDDRGNFTNSPTIQI